MSTIQIKRGTGSAVPSGLADGELAVNLDNSKIYYGSGSTSINKFHLAELVADKATITSLTSSIVSSSVIYSSGSNIFGDAQTDTHLFRGHVTTSGNISASGIMYMGTPGAHQTHLFYGRIKTIGSEVLIGDGHVSASGNISGSIIKGTTGSFGTGTTTITDKIFTTGEISGSKIDAPRVETDLIEVKSGGKLRIKGSDITLENGHISMSGDIVMTGSISGSAGTTASFAHIITGGDTIEFKNKTNGSKLGSIKFDTAKGFQIKDSNNNSGKLDAKELIVANSISSSGGYEVKNGRVTASYISSSTEIITPVLKGGGSTTGLIVDGYSWIKGAITASGEISSSGTIIAGRIKSKGSLIDLYNGHISASGNISSSAAVLALTGSFGTGTTHITDKITTDGTISSSKEITGKQLIVSERIKIKGSDITLEAGHISMSGDIVMTGSLSSSAQVRALTGSFGTGTTHITDKVVTSGDIESTSGTIRVKNVVATGRIQGKGSDVIIENGHISMSGDIIMTGSLSSSAQVQALTGSFGTGTTTITDKIHTTGIVSGSTIRSAGDIVSTTGTLHIKDVVGTGKLRMKGSDVVIENGHISMSGNMLMTGSLTAGGNVTAGSNGTGSFDHIITMDDTIEFRNKSNRSQVKGYMKFDPEKGLITLSGSNQINILQTVKIAPTDFYPIGRSTGKAGGIATLEPSLGNSAVVASGQGVFTCEVKIPKGLTPGNVVIWGSDTTNTYQVYVGELKNSKLATHVTPGASKNPTIAVGTACNPSSTFSAKSVVWNNNSYLIFHVETNGADGIFGGSIAVS